MKSLAGIVVCMGAAIAAQAYEENNLTMMRERWNAVQSPYLDIRRTVLGLNPGAAVQGRGYEITTRLYNTPRWYDADNPQAPSTALTEDWLAFAAQIRQARWMGPLGWELAAGYVRGDDASDPADIYIGATWTIDDQRHFGQTAYIGLGIPVGGGDNWIDNHNALSYRAEYRASWSFDMWAINLNAGGIYAPGGENYDRDGYIIPGNPSLLIYKWDTDYFRAEIKAMASYRFTQRVRAGLMQEWAFHNWQGDAEERSSLDADVSSAPTRVFVEGTVGTGWHISGSCGLDFLTDPGPDGMFFELGITKTIY